MEKRIIIKHANQAENVRFAVKNLLEARQNRFEESTMSAAAFGAVAYGASILLGTPWEEKPPLDFPHWAQGIILGLPLIPGIIAYKKQSRKVRIATNSIGTIAKSKKVGFLDSNRQVPASLLGTTHIGLVRKNGDIHLLPTTKRNLNLLRAQRTWLRHIVPGRYRFD
ncbi:MAG: hypothetical protein AABX01_02450 [Candidatus Micrarchaeota archaeon]